MMSAGSTARPVPFEYDRNSILGPQASVQHETKDRLASESRACFWIGVPLVIATALFWPRTIVLYTGGNALEFNRPQSPLPTGLADLAYLYRASVLGVAALLITTAALRMLPRSGSPPPVSLPACFLPTYVAGIESTGHVRWAMRCHSLSAHFNIHEFLIGEIHTCAAALAITVIAGTVAALALGHRSWFGIPIPPVVGAILLSVALPWWFLLVLVMPA